MDPGNLSAPQPPQTTKRPAGAGPTLPSPGAPEGRDDPAAPRGCQRALTVVWPCAVARPRGVDHPARWAEPLADPEPEATLSTDPAPLPRLMRPPGPRPEAGIVHLGLGAFFRAHGALYVARAMAVAPGPWGIIGVSLRRPDQRDRLAPQGCAYTAVELGPQGRTPRLVDVLEEVLVAPEDPGAVLDRMAAPGTRIVTLTVTEKGYCHEPATGRLNLSHPDIAHDLRHPDAPRSAPGFLVAALARRRAVGLAPFTVLSCDNLPSNGPMLRGLVLELACARDAALADWIAVQGRFPATMVDRIVPAVTPVDIAALADETGRMDAAPVLHEPFCQWVIEDEFVPGPRPDLAAVGVELVADVAPFEAMKLRMLNGAHSALAYLGGLAGFETVAQAVADPVLARFLRHLWVAEVAPGLTVPRGSDLAAYATVLEARFANPAIRHLTAQIAMDGSQKLPQRILAPLAENRAAGRPCAALTLVVAGWIAHLRATDAPQDPLAETVKALAATAGIAARVDGFLALRAVFPERLADDPSFRADLIAACMALEQAGPLGAAAAALG